MLGSVSGLTLATVKCTVREDMMCILIVSFILRGEINHIRDSMGVIGSAQIQVITKGRCITWVIMCTTSCQSIGCQLRNFSVDQSGGVTDQLKKYKEGVLY